MQSALAGGLRLHCNWQTSPPPRAPAGGPRRTYVLRVRLWPSALSPQPLAPAGRQPLTTGTWWHGAMPCAKRAADAAPPARCVAALVLTIILVRARTRRPRMRHTAAEQAHVHARGLPEPQGCARPRPPQCATRGGAGSGEERPSLARLAEYALHVGVLLYLCAKHAQPPRPFGELLAK